MVEVYLSFATFPEECGCADKLLLVGLTCTSKIALQPGNEQYCADT